MCSVWLNVKSATFYDVTNHVDYQCGTLLGLLTGYVRVNEQLSQNIFGFSAQTEASQSSSVLIFVVEQEHLACILNQLYFDVNDLNINRSDREKNIEKIVEGSELHCVDQIVYGFVECGYDARNRKVSATTFNENVANQVHTHTHCNVK